MFERAPLSAAAALCVAVAGVPSALAQHGHGHACDLETAEAVPILSVADFNGDGVVDNADKKLLKQQTKSGEYIAFYDRNADGVLDKEDENITKDERGAASMLMDQQIADAFWATEMYRDRANAVAADYIPFTPAFFGHGEHWALHADTGALDYTFDPSEPEGLNYDADGNLWAVFFYVGANPNVGDFNPLAAAPAGFDGHHDAWHHHAGACLLGIDYANPEPEAENLDFLECVGPGQCYVAALTGGYSAFRWNPKFHMLHLWLYELNPCGTFAGAHPHLMPHAPDPGTANPTGMSCDITDTNAAYPYSPVPTFCAWMAQIGTSIPALGCF